MSDLTPETGTTTVGYRHGVLLVLLAGALWSTMGLGIRMMEIANVWQILFYRSCALSVFLLVVITIRSGGKPGASIRKVGLAGMIGGMGLVAAFSGGIYAIQTTTVANAMFLFAFAPFLAALLGRALLKESVRPATWVAMAVAIAGICIMVYGGFAAGYIAGNLAALLSACGFAVFSVALRWRKLDDMMPTVFLAGVFAIMIAGTVCVTAGYTLAIPQNDILIAFAMGVFQVGAGLTVYTLGSKNVPAAELTLLSMTEVVLGPLWVWWLLGETAGIHTMVGGAVLMVAIAGNALSGARRRPPRML